MQKRPRWAKRYGATRGGKMHIERGGGYAFSSEARNLPLRHGMDTTTQPFVSVMVDFEAGPGWINAVRRLNRR
jgi:hypothetical protein